MESYRHTQIGWYIWLPVGTAVILMGAFGILFKMPYLYIVSGLLLLTAVLFSTLTVVVDDEKVRIAFGIGLIRKTFLIRDIASAATVKNRWWYGWGIRLVPGGWLFNVSGLGSVEIVMKSGRMYRIGTDEPEALLVQIQRRLER